MHPIRSRRDLATLLEKQMTAASTRQGSAPTIEEDIEGRAALKTFLLEAHGRMRSDPMAALMDAGAAFGLQVAPTEEPELLALSIGDLSLWLDTSLGRIFKLYSVATARDVDRVHEQLVSSTGLLSCLWLPPQALEALVRTTETRMVLFSLRHDRRPLRKTPDEQGIDSVTLRFWGPRARETLDKLRDSEVLPSATSVFSVRLRSGDDDRYCLAEVFHSGKITSIGTSFAEHDRIVRSILEDHASRTLVLEPTSRISRRINVAVPWTLDDLGFAVGKMFSGAEPFRLWGLAEQTSPTGYRVHAVDTDVGRTATFEVNADGVCVELNHRAPASVAVRFISGLQYHVNARLDATALAPEPLLQLALPAAHEGPGRFAERATMVDVARVVLAEAVALLVRGTLSVTTALLVEQTHGELGTEAIHDLARRVMSEAAAHEWRPWLKIAVGPEGKTSWRFADPLPIDASARVRELVRLNRAAQQLVARMSGTAIARWLQLSLFGPEAMVPPVAENDDGG